MFYIFFPNPVNNEMKFFLQKLFTILTKLLTIKRIRLCCKGMRAEHRGSIEPFLFNLNLGENHSGNSRLLHTWSEILS